MKNWNYWVPRAFALSVALVIFGLSLPWGAVEKYISTLAAMVRVVALLWLVGVHCLVQKRMRWFGWGLIGGTTALLAVRIVAHALEGTSFNNTLPAVRTIEINLEFVCDTAAIAALLLVYRLRGLRQIVQYATAAAVALELVFYWTFFLIPHNLMHPMWLMRDCFGLLAYIGLAITTYYIALYHEPFELHIPVGDAADRVKMECPCCMKMQDLPLGRAVCKDCGVGIRIEIEEKSCAKCGYSLRGLPGQVCPECGTPFGVQPAPVEQPA